MITYVTLLAASAISLDCVVDPPRNVIPDGDKVASQVIGLPPELNKWAFTVDIDPDQKPGGVKVDWPGDPILAGKAAGLVAIGPQDFSFISFHQGPCLFTVSSCLFLYTLSLQPDRSAVILIQPAALGTDEKRFSRPFQVYMAGRCQPKGSNQ
jgi:hypothetical protein